MIFTVFCCTFMNHCNPDSSTKTHISSHTKHVFFNNSSLQKIHISSHPEHVLVLHKGSHILSPKHAIFQRLFHRKPRYLPTQTPSFKDPSTEFSHIISHKACLFNNSLYRKFIHPLTQNMSFCMLLSQGITYPLTNPMPFFNGSSTQNSTHISAHTNHAFFQRPVHRIFTHHLTQSMSFQ